MRLRPLVPLPFTSAGPLRPLCAWALFGAAALLAAGTDTKRPLAPADFDHWRAIATPTLSRDGRWLAYSYMPI